MCCEGIRQSRTHGCQAIIARANQRIGNAANFIVHRFHHGAAVPGELPVNEVSRLNTVGTLVDRRNAHIAEELRCTGLLDIAHTAVNLHAE